MTQSPNTLMKALGPQSPVEARPRVVAAAAGLPLFRFRLRHLFVGVTALSLLLAGLVSLEGIPALALLLGALVVTFHVFGTALGSQLRRHADRPDAEPVSALDRAEHDPGHRTHQASRPNLPPWYGRTASSVTWLPRFVAVAMLLGGGAGAVLLTATVGQRTSLSGLLVGAVSMAVVSGWLAFLGGSLIAIVRGGLNEAVEETHSHDNR